MSPYIVRQKVEPSFFETLLKTEPKFNAIIEINNLLASKPIKSISSEEVDEIIKKYKLKIKKSYKVHFQNFYSVYLHYCFDDRKLTKLELEDLQHLKKILFLSDDETALINREVSERVYAEETKKALTDGRLTSEEKKFLNDLQGTLSISEKTAKKIYNELAQDYFKNFFSEIVSDNRISLEEEKELEEIANSLGIEVNMDDRAKSTFDRMKMLWLIENNKMPSVEANLPLLNGEACHFKTACRWLEETKGKKADSPEKRKISLTEISNSDSFSIKPEDDLDIIDKGQVYITSKRIIFMGAKGGKSIPFNKITGIAPFLNGFEIEQENEKSCFLNFHEHIDIFLAIVSRSVKI